MGAFHRSLSLVFFVSAAAFSADEFTDRSRDFFRVLSDVSRVSREGKDLQTHEAKLLVRKTSEMVDFVGLAKRSLGTRWGALPVAQREDFLATLQRLLEDLAYPQAHRIFVAPEKVKFSAVPGRAGHVDAKGDLESDRKGERVVQKVELTLIFDPKSKKLVDFVFEGEAFSRNLKRQFDEALKKRTFAQIIEQMKRRLAEAKSSGGSKENKKTS